MEAEDGAEAQLLPRAQVGGPGREGRGEGPEACANRPLGPPPARVRAVLSGPSGMATAPWVGFDEKQCGDQSEASRGSPTGRGAADSKQLDAHRAPA